MAMNLGQMNDMIKLLIFLCGALTAMTIMVFIPNKTTYEKTDQIVIINAIVTMYTSDPRETDDTPTITASGELVRPGTIACPAFLPFGTKIEINGQRYTCADRMAKRYRHGNYFDIWGPNKQIALEHGRQEMEVKVIHTPVLADANR